ncbi:30S ribosomal protein S1 [Hydrogenibacillus schlegelii]|uniref:30S ribosomal protein S1 n=1 Tax=Hydrogenibacillus schlegelii TaxID=1484 RepID=A0A132N8U9_HYDSH|nr:MULTISPECIES: 30S ribosomal protein S1 [Hydrogenibacillus]KWX06534.1 30S ribosomal protein S1 [Hydrogenibacillus schlegelii]MBT9282365.1 30S ribosomal protein S1 [Hydrogenibacillus schlegelii]OAR05539.1 30S ribosomal protein S1 [Hydrogenibacillus schlegelii]QZA32353.1 30S ribosomal protein S1 [Hydrogenibacillus sp. N12]
MMEEHEAMHGGELAIPQVGDRLTGKVVKIEDKQALVDVGYKYEAILPISEVSALHIDRIDDVLSVGDEIRVQVKKVNDEKEELVVSKRMVDAEEAWARLAGYRDRGEAFEVKVHDIVKGGLVADVGLRGFIPASQVSTSFVEDFSDYKGKTLKVKVLELDREQNRVILSHRAVLEEEAEAKKAEVLSRLRPGDVVEGRVARFADFGAFIDLGGVDGLVHISEVSWEHVEHPSEKLKIGDVVKVKVLKVDPESERVSLSIKQAEASPWERAKDEIRVGEIREGIVRRLASFGAFVELMPGVEGLVHISQLARRRVATPSEVVSPGQKVRVKVLAFSPEEKRVSLSIREAEEAEPAPRPEPAAKEEDKSGFGVTIGDLLGDRLPDAWK